MADPQTIDGTVAETNQWGFKLQGSNVWTNYTKPEWQRGLREVQKGQQVTFQAAESNGKWYANDIVVTSTPHPAASYDGMQQAAASPAPSAPAPSPEQPRNAAESGTPEPGSFPYRDLIGIPRSVCLNDAVAALVGVCGAAALEPLPGEQLDNLARNIVWLAKRLHEDYYLDASRPSDKIFIGDIAEPAKSPSQMDAPPPEWGGDPGPQP